ncbi:long-chain fatty acid--CoA ligase [Agromyces endophyticus]|uniref:AMP-binding enzyme n=1 Tax=Agromyces sp. H17E-10 TaxID=2932244 RepID=UPI001FD3A226|nr:long-chain fatty acid--CoA ligase [Agromyces sp. H17E-10]UOQ88742.1 long-chain fatty acid--CoA ligase [Agromyces sp. H17E-10]
MSGWLRGPHEAVALAFDGDVVRMGELADAVAAVDLPGDGPIGCPAGMPPAALITTVLAALERGRPVLVGGDDDDASNIARDLPAGAELVLLTSGSSGPRSTPRAVARTEHSWLASAAPLAQIVGLEAADRVAVTGPLHVSMHLYAALHALWAGASVGDRVADATVVHATPTRLARLLDGPLTARTVVVAGAVLDDSLRERAGRRLRLVEYYGAAELSFVAAGGPDGLTAFPGVELDLRPVAAGLELWARSPYLALGTTGGGMLRRDAAGFATVGDLVEPTHDGAFTVLGRGDSAITTAGATVIAERVERVLETLPGVASAAVVGEPHALLGERVVAVVELERPESAGGAPGDATSDATAPVDAAATATALAAAARRHLDAAELPRRWIFRPLPRTASGKVARGRVRAAVVAGDFGEAQARTAADDAAAEHVAAEHVADEDAAAEFAAGHHTESEQA